jgi:hypothetical protein
MAKKWVKYCENCGAKTRKKFVNFTMDKNGRKFLMGMKVFYCKKCRAVHYIDKERKKVLKETDRLYELAEIKESEEKEVRENVDEG